MYRVEINGTFHGHYATLGEAMTQVDKWARPLGHKWKITDGSGKIYAQG